MAKTAKSAPEKQEIVLSDKRVQDLMDDTGYTQALQTVLELDLDGLTDDLRAAYKVVDRPVETQRDGIHRLSQELIELRTMYSRLKSSMNLVEGWIKVESNMQYRNLDELRHKLNAFTEDGQTAKAGLWTLIECYETVLVDLRTELRFNQELSLLEFRRFNGL